MAALVGLLAVCVVVGLAIVGTTDELIVEFNRNAQILLRLIVTIIIDETKKTLTKKPIKPAKNKKYHIPN